MMPRWAGLILGASMAVAGCDATPGSLTFYKACRAAAAIATDRDSGDGSDASSQAAALSAAGYNALGDDAKALGIALSNGDHQGALTAEDKYDADLANTNLGVRTDTGVSCASDPEASPSPT